MKTQRTPDEIRALLNELERHQMVLADAARKLGLAVQGVDSDQSTTLAGEAVVTMEIAARNLKNTCDAWDAGDAF